MNGQVKLYGTSAWRDCTVDQTVSDRYDGTRPAGRGHADLAEIVSKVGSVDGQGTTGGRYGWDGGDLGWLYDVLDRRCCLSVHRDRHVVSHVDGSSDGAVERDRRIYDRVSRAVSQ